MTPIATAGLPSRNGQLRLLENSDGTFTAAVDYGGTVSTIGKTPEEAVNALAIVCNHEIDLTPLSCQLGDLRSGTVHTFNIEDMDGPPRLCFVGSASNVIQPPVAPGSWHASVPLERFSASAVTAKEALEALYRSVCATRTEDSFFFAFIEAQAELIARLNG